MPELLEMKMQTPLQNTKHAAEIASQPKQPSAPQALVATPSLQGYKDPFFNISWLAVEEVNQQDMELKLTNIPERQEKLCRQQYAPRIN